MTSLGKYELHEQLGRGGFGTVYRATDTTLDREVALKILHPELTINPDFLDRFRNEARLVASLDSPHIVSIYEMGEVEGRFFLAMKYLPGGSLSDLLQKKGALPFKSALQIMDDICSGLSLAHRKGLVHRDLKPSNVLFDGEGRAVINDFGLARAVQVSSSTSISNTSAVGTPAYRAPELWLGKPPASPATDIYSLGCIFSEMLTGKVLFDGETTEVILARHLITGPDIPDVYPSGTPSDIRSIILTMVAKDSSQRFQDSVSFSQTLKSYQRDEAIPPIRDIPKKDPKRKLEPPILAKKPGASWIGIGFAVMGIVLFITLGIATHWFGLAGPAAPTYPTDNYPAVVVTEAPGPPAVTQPPGTEEPVYNPPVNQVTDTPIVIMVMSTAEAPITHPPSARDFLVCLGKCNLSGSNSVSSVPEKTSKVYFRFSFENFPQNAHVIRRWISNGEEWVRYDCRWNLPTSGIFEGPLYDKSLRSGTWEYEMYVDGDLIISGSFYVEGNDQYFDPNGTTDSCMSQYSVVR
ncbi:MAG TPA: serine/threonine-protein kinase [Anaerolineaceae bacterium]|nr:serine/threonine-protein kinase [Anaerolineaceae bacterium]